MQINSMASLFQFMYGNGNGNGNKKQAEAGKTTQTPPITPQQFVDLFGMDPSMFLGGNFPGVSLLGGGGGGGGGGGAGAGMDPKAAQALQEKTDKEQEEMQLRSNLQKKKHDTCMAIIANIR